MYKNIVWDLIGKFGNQIVTFGISIFLTRLLSPEEYGIMGMAMVVIAFAHIFLDLGFNRAIIQQAEVSDVQYATIFYLNTVIALLLTVICFFLAGPLSVYYGQPLIKPVFRAVSISFLLNGLNLVPSAILYKRLLFKVNSIQTLLAAILSGCVGVILAYNGYGVWSLVVQSLLGSLLLMLFNFIYLKWFPALVFQLASIKPLWRYGSKMFASGLLDTIYTRLDTFIIAKIFTPSTLGFYTRAQSMDNMVRQFSANSIMGALFPYIAKHQDDRVYLKELYEKYLHIILFVSVGLSAVLFLIAQNLFTVLFTSRWLYAAELFQLMSIAGFAWPVSSLMCNIIAGVGNSSAFFRLEVYKKLMVLPVYIFGFLLGLKGFIICMVVMGFAGVTLNGVFTGKEINMTLYSQLKIIFSYICLGTASCLLSYFILLSFPVLHAIVAMIIQATLFTFFYVTGAYVAKLSGTEIINTSFQRLKLAFQ